jgi:hypothetical protein
VRIDSFLEKVSNATSFLSFKTEVPVQPPVLGGGNRFPYGPFQFRIQLAKAAPYEIQASTDMRHWKVIADGVVTEENFEYLDSDASKFSHRFYRVRTGELFSINVIGYATMTLPPGFSMISNPFDSSSNSVSELFKDWPNGAMFSRFDMGLFRLTENCLQGGKWTNPHEQLAVGEGALFFNPISDYKPLSFWGEVMQGSSLSIPVPAGFSVRSSLIPQAGDLVEDLKFPIAEGDVIHLFDRDAQKYVSHPFEDGKWKSGAPVIGIGESFWVAKTSAKNWTRDLTIQ